MHNRNHWRWTSAIACLLAAVWWVHASDDGRTQSKKVKVSRNSTAQKKVEPLTWTEKGWGGTVHDAEELMLVNAVASVFAHLKTLEPPLIWVPPVDYIRKHLISGQPQRCQDQEPEWVNGKKVECWSWTVSISPSQIESMRREDSKYRAELVVRERSIVAEARMLAAAKVLGCFVLGLAGVCLALRRRALNGATQSVAEDRRRRTHPGRDREFASLDIDFCLD